MGSAREALECSVFVGNELLGTFMWKPRPEAGEHAYHSLAYFCPECGEIWARVVVSGHPFFCGFATCSTHCPGFMSEYGGSLLQMWSSDFYYHWPREVWQREAEIVCAAPIDGEE